MNFKLIIQIVIIHSSNKVLTNPPKIDNKHVSFCSFQILWWSSSLQLVCTDPARLCWKFSPYRIANDIPIIFILVLFMAAHNILLNLSESASWTLYCSYCMISNLSSFSFLHVFKYINVNIFLCQYANLAWGLYQNHI